MRLIDADALLEKIDMERDILVKDGRLGAEHIVTHYVRNFIEDAPTADVVEVVRCKDCKHYKDIFCGLHVQAYCDREGREMRKPSDFCSYGEKR